MKRLAAFLLTVIAVCSLFSCSLYAYAAESQATAPATLWETDAYADGWYRQDVTHTDETGNTVKDGETVMYIRNGAPLVGLKSVDGKTYYFDEGGLMVTGFAEINGSTYHFGTDGVMTRYSAVIGGKSYYFYGDGRMHRGWITFRSNGKRRYYNTDGVMVRYSYTVNGKAYYFNGDGWMQTGWITFQDGKKHYYQSGGAMAVGWLKIGGRWYYFDKDGAMARYSRTIDGQDYYFNGSGVMVTGWIRFSGKYRYYYSNGSMAKNDWVGYRYYVDGNGYWVKNKAVPVNIALGVKRDSVVRWLSSHETDSYYLGTPYAAPNANSPSTKKYGWNIVGCIRPNGRYTGRYPGMNCGGFVADALTYGGAGWSNLEKLGSNYHRASVWYSYVMNNHLLYYRFSSVEQALRSGKLSKGDIIFFKPLSSGKDRYGNASDYHMGFFWGNSASDNRFWHSSWNIAVGVPGAGTLKNGNQISVLSPMCDSEVYVFPLG